MPRSQARRDGFGCDNDMADEVKSPSTPSASPQQQQQPAALPTVVIQNISDKVTTTELRNLFTVFTGFLDVDGPTTGVDEETQAEIRFASISFETNQAAERAQQHAVARLFGEEAVVHVVRSDEYRVRVTDLGGNLVATSRQPLETLDRDVIERQYFVHDGFRGASSAGKSVGQDYPCCRSNSCINRASASTPSSGIAL